MHELDRRTLLRGLAALSAMGTFTLAELREARAQTERTGKPLLTEASLNRLLAKVRGDGAAAEKAMANLHDFLQAHLTLTKRQAVMLRRLQADTDVATRSRKALRASVQAAQRRKVALVVSVNDRGGACDRDSDLVLRSVAATRDGGLRLEAVPVKR